MLDVNRTLGQVDPIDDPVRAGLDRRQPSLVSPLVEPQSLRAEQDLPPRGPYPPADRARTDPLPTRRAEGPLVPRIVGWTLNLDHRVPAIHWSFTRAQDGLRGMLAPEMAATNAGDHD